MSIRVFDEGWRKQYARMHRSRVRLGAAHRGSDEYDDAFYHAVQDAWHLKDWIREDTALPAQLRHDISQQVDKNEPLGIVADLADCTKHLILTKFICRGATLQSSNSEISLGSGRMTRELVVARKDGNSRFGAALLEEAHRVWDEILASRALL